MHGSNVDRDTGYFEVFLHVAQSLQAKAEIIYRIGHDHFIPNPFHFTQQSSCH
jgi:hypothetical protein